MNLTTMAGKVANRTRSTVRWQQRLNNWDIKRFDRRLGVRTTGRLVPTEGTVCSGDASLGVIYIGTQPRLWRWVLTGLPRNRSDFTLVDMGSGEGRVLLFAKQAGFRQAIGVEFVEELHEVASCNAINARERGVFVDPVLGDAARFEFPANDPLIVHFNNPFHRPVMERVITNLAESYERQPRPIVVVYHQLTIEDPGDETGNLSLLDQVPFLQGRTLRAPAGMLDRKLLAPFTVRIYESTEVGPLL